MSSRADPAGAAFSPQRLSEILNCALPLPQRYWVGFSGGMDSTVLLHALAQVRDQLVAPLSVVHIDHRLQCASADWARHCGAVAERLALPFTALSVDARPGDGESPEAAARKARYQAIAELSGIDDMLLTAHHLDDQAETLLLQLMRGAGIDGLASMPLSRRWAAGWLARPLLSWRRSQLLDWALQQGLQWIDDPSNDQPLPDRNFIRHEILPRLQTRWPAAAESIARSASWCADAMRNTEYLAESLLDEALSGQGNRLQCPALRGMPAEQATVVLRQWLRRSGVELPSARKLHELLQQLLYARGDAAVRVDVGAYSIRRFRDQVWLVREWAKSPTRRRLDWIGDSLELGDGLGRLLRRKGPGGIDPARWREGHVQVGFREPAMRCQPAGRAGHRSFKKLAQDFAVPPWLRDWLPILFIDNQVAAVADLCVCEPFALDATKRGWHLVWLQD